jgi:hypothetical protein
MSKAFVHIGLPKTGTTSFQTALLKARPALRERGIRVLEYEGSLDSMSLPTMAMQLGPTVIRPELDSWFRQVDPEAVLPEYLRESETNVRMAVESGEPVLVASYEGLSLMRTREEVARLRELFAPRELVVILVLRERASYRKSLRQQLSFVGIRTSSHFPSSCSNLASDSWLFNQQALIDVLIDVLGRASVRIIDYESALASDSTIIPALWSECELPRDVLTTELLSLPRANQSPDLTREHLPPNLDSIEDLEYLRDLISRQAVELGRMRSSRSWRYTRFLRRLRGNDRYYR